MRPSLKANLVANFAGRGFTAISGVIFVPVFLHYLGVEGYGLFALLNSYMVVAALLDLGFSLATTREVARLSAIAPERMRDMVWTISVPYCSSTILIGIAIYFGAPWIASHAIAPSGGVPPASVVRAVGYAGFALTLQLPIYLYTGGLAGLERQDLANAVTIVSTALRYGAAVLILSLISRSVALLMVSQAVVAGLTAAAAFIVLWSQMPGNGRRPRFRLDLLREAWRLAASIGGTAVLSTVVLQADKVIIGALLPLAVVGHYMVASVIANNIALIAQPVINVTIPRLTQLTAIRDWASSRVTFHKLSELVALMLLPLTVTIAAFPQETLFVWTGNPTIAQGAAPLLRLMTIGMSFNAAAGIPYALIVTRERTGALLLASLVSSAIILPVMFLATSRFGAIGTAAAICTYYAMGCLICAALVRPLLGRPAWSSWIAADVLLPGAAIVVVVLVAAVFSPALTGRPELLALLAATWLGATIIAALVMPWMRQQALFYLRQIRDGSLWMSGMKP